MRIFPVSAVLVVLFLFSCTSQQKITNYLQRVDTTDQLLLNMPEPKIQKGDLLSIKVYSQSADPRTDIPYNLPEQSVGGSTGGGTAAGFLVDETGNIEYPQIGTVHAEGLTKGELAKQIKGQLNDVLKNPSVIVRFLNYRITVLGEVKAPGTFSTPTDRVTILEALGLAGDITEFGERDSVKVLREVDGQAQIGVVSLASSNLFHSPYYRLQQNDVVFVEQARRKAEEEARRNRNELIRTGISIITVLAVIVNFFR